MYDLLMLGGGPGGYTAAIRAAQLGMKVLCVDDRAGLGGVCLNVGCIPSKVLLNTSEFYWKMNNEVAEWGIHITKDSINITEMMANKEKIVKGFNNGVSLLFRKNKVDYVRGYGKIKDAHTVEVDGKPYETKKIVVATGSHPVVLDSLPIDEKNIVTSTGALSFSSVPSRLVVIGGGIIGVELGSVWNNLGATVDILEANSQFLSIFDTDVSKTLGMALKDQGLKIHVGSTFKSMKVKSKLIEVTYEQGGKVATIMADKILVSVGRKPNIKGFGLEDLNVAIDDNGFIKVNENYETSVKDVHAIGDCIGNPMLAHKSEEEGVVCVERMTGMKTAVDYKAISSVLYTNPEVSVVGESEKSLKEKGIAYKIGKFPFLANSRARAISQPTGFAKILADEKTDRILGASIVGPMAGELISEVVAIMVFGGSAEDLGRIIHAHPTFQEALKEAGLAVNKEAINI